MVQFHGTGAVTVLVGGEPLTWTALAERYYPECNCCGLSLPGSRLNGEHAPECDLVIAARVLPQLSTVCPNFDVATDLPRSMADQVVAFLREQEIIFDTVRFDAAA